MISKGRERKRGRLNLNSISNFKCFAVLRKTKVPGGRESIAINSYKRNECIYLDFFHIIQCVLINLKRNKYSICKRPPPPLAERSLIFCFSKKLNANIGCGIHTHTPNNRVLKKKFKNYCLLCEKNKTNFCADF